MKGSMGTAAKLHMNNQVSETGLDEPLNLLYM
jgi:hypothetical protein